MKLLQWIKSLFANTSANYNNWHIEAYLENKKPKNGAEVEYWIRRYEHETRQKGWAQ